MPIPNLLKPAILTIEAVDKSSTVYHERFREPVGDVRRTTLTIPAQRWNVHRQMPSFDQGGVSEQFRGWWTIRRVDTIKYGWTPTRGDKAIKFGAHVTELYINQIEPMGHWENGPELFRCYFSDRRPAAAKPDLS